MGMFVVWRPLLNMVFFLALECSSMLHVYVRGVIDVVFSVCIVTRGALSACVWEV